MKKLLIVLCVIFGAGCYLGPIDAYDNCIVFQDEYGERELCGVATRVIDGHLFYWDERFGIWVSGGYGYYENGVLFYGYHPGWRIYWRREFYHPRGWYHGGGRWHRGGWRYSR